MTLICRVLVLLLDLKIMKYNFGCGENKFDGFINVDKSPIFDPELVMDLEVTPWNIESHSADIILMFHILEHLGQTPDSFINIMKELYRISKHNCELIIKVPHPYHYCYITDPTHIRPITPELLAPWSKEQCKHVISRGIRQTNFALIHDVDFHMEKIKYTWDEEILSILKQMNLIPQDLGERCYDDTFTRIFSNLVSEIEIKLLVKKR